MNRLFALIAIALAPLAFAVDYEFLAGSTDKFVMVNMYGTDGTPKTGLAYTDMTITYTRNNGSADVDVTEATMTMGTHADGGWIQVDSTNSPGLYQFAMPDAAIASGAESVTFSFKATSTFQRFIQASIVNVDFRGSSYVPANTVQIEGSDATNQINTEADTALNDYDGPTNAELNARTLAAANYFDPATDTVALVSVVSTLTGHTPQTADYASSIAAILADTSALDTTTELRTAMTGADTPVAKESSLGTAQTADHTASIAAILADTGALDTNAELRTAMTGADTPVAKESSITTAQADLDIITGSNGVTLATTQPNYAPYTGTPPTVGQIRTEMESSGTKLSLVLADTDEMQTRFGLMIEADGGDWRFDTNALEQAPSGGGGGGGDATAANQTLILADLDEIKGTTFISSTDSLEAIRNQGDAAWGDASGSGDTPVNHNTGGVDTLRFVDGSGAGIEGATIKAYVKEDYDDDIFTVRGQVKTAADGRWVSNLMLDDGIEYTLVFYKPGAFGPITEDVTP